MRNEYAHESDLMEIEITIIIVMGLKALIGNSTNRV